MKTKKVSVREFQHHLSYYLELAQTQPLIITKHGKPTVIVSKSTKTNDEKEPQYKEILNLPFVGMYQDRKDWQEKSAIQIADKLRYDTWYGK